MKRKLLCAFLFLVMLICLASCESDKSGAYDKALKLFASGDYDSAAKAFDALGDHAQSPIYAAYSHGLVLYNQGQFSAAAPYFAQTIGFMYGSSRYAFCNAHSLLEEENYQEALSLFEKCSDMEEAPQLADYCRAQISLAAYEYDSALLYLEKAGSVLDAPDLLVDLQGQIYNRAIALRQEGDYENAITLFSLLGDYLSSAEQAIECNSASLDAQYEEAERLMNSGDLLAAYEGFSAIASYRDAAAKAQTLADKLGIHIKTADDLY